MYSYSSIFGMKLRTKIFLGLCFFALGIAMMVLSFLSYRILSPDLSVAYWLSVKYPIGFWNPENLDFENAWITTDDGIKLHGWYLPHKSPRATVLFAHGSGGNMTWESEALRRLTRDLSLSVLLFDYRGYGKSEGKPNEQGLYLDARAAKQWLAARSQVAPNEIVLLGCSLGGAVMVDLASEEGAKALILVDTFTSVKELSHYYNWLPEVAWGGEIYDTFAKIEKYQGPLFMKHGDADTVVPYASAMRLFQRANEPKVLLTEPGGKHDERSEQFYNELNKFIENIK